MSVVSFDGTHIFSDSICVMNGDVETTASKVHVHRTKRGSYLVAFFVGQYGAGMKAAQAVFDEYESGALHERLSFSLRTVAFADDTVLDFYIVDADHKVMFYYDLATNSFSRHPLAPITLGFSLGLHLINVLRADGSDWKHVARMVELGSNMRANNARYAAPPYRLTNIFTGESQVINLSE